MSFRTKWESLVMELKGRHDEICKENFFDVQIHCRNIILPAHRYVLSSSSLYLAEQLASGVDKLNWTEFEEPTCIALLRWIYTNKVVFGFTTDGTAEQWQDLLLASYKLELVSLFTICEEKLVPLLIGDDSSHRSGPFLRLNSTSKKVSANQLIQKCSKPRLSVNEVAPEEPAEPKAKISNLKADSDCSGSENCSDDRVYEQMANEYWKFATGYDTFRQFSDLNVTFENHVLRAHSHVIGNRSKKIVEELRAAEGNDGIGFYLYTYSHTLLRWMYTDCIVFEDNDSKYDLLEASQFYELPALFERCEDALMEQVDIRSCGYYHQIAVKENASKLFKRCIQVIAKYFNKPESPDCFQMDYEHRFDDSLNQTTVSESSTDAGEGLLTLNDDCLLHIFRFVSVADLGSIKDTCKRLSSLADQSFRIREDKSLEFSRFTMFADIWILKHFGKFIKSLKLESYYDRYTTLNDVLELIAQCTGEELKSIAFRKLRDEKSISFECLKTVLKTVECIELQSVYHSTHINSLLGFCENLKEVCIRGGGIELSSDWCVKNPNVTKLTLDGLTNDSILEEICKQLTRLESLSVVDIRTETDGILYLGQLSHLEELRLESSMIDKALERFTDKTVLEDLTLVNAHLTESLFNVLGEFPNLSNLAFEKCSQITSEAIMDRDDYLRLVKTRNLQIFVDY